MNDIIRLPDEIYSDKLIDYDINQIKLNIINAENDGDYDLAEILQLSLNDVINKNIKRIFFNKWINYLTDLRYKRNEIRQKRASKFEELLLITRWDKSLNINIKKYIDTGLPVLSTSNHRLLIKQYNPKYKNLFDEIFK